MTDTIILLWATLVGGFSAILFTFRAQIISKTDFIETSAVVANKELSKIEKKLIFVFPKSLKDVQFNFFDLLDDEDNFFLEFVKLVRQELLRITGISIENFGASIGDGTIQEKIVAFEREFTEKFPDNTNIEIQRCLDFVRPESFMDIFLWKKELVNARSGMINLENQSRSLRLSMNIAIIIMILLVVSVVIDKLDWGAIAAFPAIVSIVAFIELIIHAKGERGDPKRLISAFKPVQSILSCVVVLAIVCACMYNFPQQMLKISGMEKDPLLSWLKELKDARTESVPCDRQQFWFCCR